MQLTQRRKVKPNKAVYTTKNELLYFLRFLEHFIMNGRQELKKQNIQKQKVRFVLVLSKMEQDSVFDTNHKIQEFLRHDTSFRLADKYLIAMVFIYFKRAQLGFEDYTYLNFFAGLCLAHSMEEDIELCSEIYPWALGNELKNALPRLLELKILLWVAMDYRAAVSRHCCKQLTSISANHPIWQRKRSPLKVAHFLSVEADRDFRNEEEVEEKGRKL